MKALVTGGSGFIGSRLIERLLGSSTEVMALVRPEGSRRPVNAKVRKIAVDLMDAGSVEKVVRDARPEVVFHCAMSSGHPSNAGERLEALATAVTATAHLAEGALNACVRRFVHLGSFLGYRPQTRAIREIDPIEPHSDRGAAKAMASIWLQQFAKDMQFPVVELRIFSVYGPGEPDHRFIPVLLRAARDGAAVSLLPGVSRDLVYVDDVVDACVLAADAPVTAGAVFNIGGGRSWTNLEVVETAREVSGRPIEIAEGYPGKSADGWWLADNTKAADKLGWRPTRTLHRGLTEALACLT